MRAKTPAYWITLGAFIATVIALVLIATGCASRSDRHEKTKAKQDANDNAAVSNRLYQATIGAGYTMASGHVLGMDPDPTKFTQVAKSMLDRAELAFNAADVMPPSAEVLKLRAMVEGLVSTNAQIQLQASNSLALRDKLLAASETRALKLEKDAIRLQEERDKQDRENAALADKWARMIRLLWYAGIGLVAIIVLPLILRVASMFVPALAGLDVLVQRATGKLVKGVTTVMPKAVDGAGLVVREQYDRLDGAFASIVDGVEEFKKSKPEAADELNLKLLKATRSTSVADQEVDRLKHRPRPPKM